MVGTSVLESILGNATHLTEKKKKKKGINAEGHIGEGLSTASGMGVDE